MGNNGLTQTQRKISWLAIQVSKQKYYSFATRRDNDDVACFDLDKGGMVCIVHDFASPGWEGRRKFSGSIWDWFKMAVEDMIEYDPPEG